MTTSTLDPLDIILADADPAMLAEVNAANARMFATETRRRPMFRPAERHVKPQVKEFCQLSTGIKDIHLAEFADLRERAGRQPRRRHVLGDPGARRAKYEIETGIRRDGSIKRPMEPWSCPGSRTASMALYFRVMHSAPGEVWLGDLTEDQLTAVKWMRDQELVSLSDGDDILPLSDARPPESRTYPGAPVGDGRARAGRTLRDAGRGLVLAAIANMSAGRSVRRSRKRRRETLTADGIAITAAEVAGEANRIKSRRADLAEHRYLSLDTCRRIIRELIKGGVLDELAPPTPARRRRSWLTLPRVIRRVPDTNLDLLGRPKERHDNAA